MADLVLGLAKSAVEGTLTMANMAIEEEKKLQRSVKCDLMLISDEFEMMHSFLNVSRDHIANDMASTLVRQVRNMALDVEDCIESVIHLDNKSSWWRHLLPSCLPPAAPVAALDDAVADMELLKARVEAMGGRNRRYSHIGGSNSKPSEQMHQQAVANATTLDILVEARGDMDECGRLDLLKLIGKKHDVLQLQVISVWGTASNVGMASTIKEAYEEAGIRENFKRRAWVKLMHPFNTRDFIWSLLFQFYRNCSSQQGSTVDVMKPLEMIESTQGGLFGEFMQQVSHQRYLVIVEGISTMDDWDIIRAYLPDNNNGSCIIVHTQQLEIASFCIGHSYRVSELKRFSDDHSVCVFSKEDTEKDVQTTKEKAAHVWLDKFDGKRVGREIDLKVLHHMTIDAGDREVIAMWGIAGVGKSSIAKHVYCSELVLEKSTFEKFGWVNVSHPLNVRDLSRNLLLDLHFGSLQNGCALRIKDPIQECRDLLHEHRCLVVIDGLQSKEEWDMIKSALVLEATQSPRNSCIIVITNEESVAQYCGTKTWNIRVLEVDEYLELYTKVSQMQIGSSDLSPQVIDQAKHILHKCGGLPKVIVAVADFLTTRLNTSNDIEICRMLNNSFVRKLETDQAFGSLQGLFAWLHSYFLTCPDFLKPCIFYLSIFPVNHNIQRRRLVRRWVAEGYSRDNKNSTAEETAEEFFTMLVKLSMIRLVGSRILSSLIRMSLCQVNGFFREFIISQSMEENLVFSLEGHCSMNSQRTGRHLAIGSTWDRDQNVFESIDFSRLRSLTVFGEWRSFFITEKMRLLRVLDLEDAKGVTEKDLEQMVKFLPRLKFLSLRGSSHISRLPNSLGDLWHLQTLDISDTSIVKVPKSIIKLHRLQFILAGTTARSDNDPGTVKSQPTPSSTPSMSKPQATTVSWLSEFCIQSQLTDSKTRCVKVPRGIGRLTALNTLDVIDISFASGEAISKELKKLTQLRRLGVSGINRKNSQEFFSAISGHNLLELLSVHLSNDNEGCLDGISQPPENLRNLKLYGLIGKLPAWIKLLQSLTKLNLEMIMLPQEEIDRLGDLPKLAILSLCFDEYQDGELQFRTGLKLLHVLEITCKSRLRAVKFCTRGFSNLVALKLHCSSESNLQVSGLLHLSALKEVWLRGSYDEGLKQHLRKQLAEHPNEIKPVLREASWSSLY